MQAYSTPLVALSSSKSRVAQSDTGTQSRNCIQPTCEDGSCTGSDSVMQTQTCTRASRDGVALKGSVAYLTTYPCWDCVRALARVGVVRILYSEAYRVDSLVLDTAGDLGIEVISFDGTGDTRTVE